MRIKDAGLQKITCLYIAIAAAIALSGCGAQETQKHSETHHVSKADKVSKHDHANNYAKPGANIRLVSQDAIVLVPGEESAHQILFNIAKPEGQLYLKLKPSDGLALVNTAPEQTFNLSQETMPLAVDVNLNADNKGTYSLLFQLKHSFDGHESSRALGLAVQAGELIQAKAKAGDQEKPHPKVISMPAEEEIITHD